MSIIILVEYIINFILLLLFYMHMFQLNSYSFKSHIRWIGQNKDKITIHTLLILLPTLFVLFNTYILNIASCLILLLNLIYAIPDKKAKVSFKITNRVIRLFITQIILILLILSIKGISYHLLFKLGIITLLTPILFLIANFINLPLERVGKQRYINEAKKILKSMPNLIVIGVTGSYGKTSVKNFLTKILSSKYEVLTTPQNYNTPMGVVKTIRENLKATHQIFICEMGARNIGEIKEICDIVNPTLGIITSVGPQHLETFKSIENISKTKFELADYIIKNNGKVFLNFDNEYILKHVNKLYSNSENTEISESLIKYGSNNNSLDYSAYSFDSSSKGLSFKVKSKHANENDINETLSLDNIQFNTKLIGKHNIVNLTGAIAIANYLKVPSKSIALRIKEINSVEHRLQVISKGKLTIIDDSYNSNPISSKSALDTLNEFKGLKIIVTPGLVELGKEEKKYNFEFGKYMTKICDYIFLVGEEHYKPILDGINSEKFDENKVFIVKSPQEAIKKISTFKTNKQINILLENDLPDNYN